MSLYHQFQENNAFYVSFLFTIGDKIVISKNNKEICIYDINFKSIFIFDESITINYNQFCQLQDNTFIAANQDIILCDLLSY